MRNEQGYNSLTGRSAIADVQTLVRARPKTVPCQPPRPRNLGVAKLGNRGTEMEGWYVWVLWTSPEAQEYI